jgi:hypothetical protein
MIEDYDVIDNSMYEEKKPTTLKVSQVDMSFFTTNEKYFNALDNAEILRFIQEKYPNISVSSTDLLIKKSIIELLNDKSFMLILFNRYNINIYDFFRIFHKDYGNLFKGPFLKKVKTSLELNMFI